MKLKKLNALTALLAIAFMLAHIIYNIFCYLALYYNPVLKMVFSIPILVLVCVHAVLGMLCVFLLPDGTSAASYPKKNWKTIVQRVCAALIFPLLIFHLDAFTLFTGAMDEKKYFLVVLIAAGEVLFFTVVVLHIAVSFSRALITLGLLSSAKKQMIIDRVLLIAGVIFVVIASIIVIRGQIIIASF